jgi:hypothetical protein
LRTSDFNRPNGDVARSLDERNRNNGRGNV